MKFRQLIIATAAIVLIVSIRANVQSMTRDRHATQMATSQIYSDLTATVSELKGFIDLQQPDAEPVSRYGLEKAALYLTKVDLVIKNYGDYNKNGLYYPGTPSFDYIADTLIGGWRTTNGTTICGVLWDDAVSKKELEYLGLLSDDLQGIVDKMVGSDGLNANTDLSITQMNTILKAFYEKWARFDMDCPYMLLRGL